MWSYTCHVIIGRFWDEEDGKTQESPLITLMWSMCCTFFALKDTNQRAMKKRQSLDIRSQGSLLLEYFLSQSILLWKRTTPQVILTIQSLPCNLETMHANERGDMRESLEGGRLCTGIFIAESLVAKRWLITKIHVLNRELVCCMISIWAKFIIAIFSWLPCIRSLLHFISFESTRYVDLKH